MARRLLANLDRSLMEERANAMDYYLGHMEKDMPAQDGRSRAVSMDVADTIEGMLPHLMDIFAGSDEVVRFEPVGPEDEEAAQQDERLCRLRKVAAGIGEIEKGIRRVRVDLEDAPVVLGSLGVLAELV
jgi:hypothetical protein